MKNINNHINTIMVILLVSSFTNYSLLNCTLSFTSYIIPHIYRNVKKKNHTRRYLEIKSATDKK